MEEKTFQGMAYRTTDIDPAKRTLLLIHGLSGSLSAWYPYEVSLSRDFNVLSVDIRGHGLSSHPVSFEGYDPKYSADDIAALLEYLHLRDVVVVSHSYGTIIALMLLRDHRNLAGGSIFISPVYGFRRRRFSMLLQEGSALLTSLLSIFKGEKKGERTEYSRFTPATDWDLKRISADVRHTGFRSYIYSFRHIAMKDFDPEWKDVTLPVLILHGTKDTYVPVRFAKELSENLPHAQLHLIEGGNHILPLNHVEEIERCIRNFAKAI